MFLGSSSCFILIFTSEICQNYLNVNFIKLIKAADVYYHCSELANFKISCTDRNPGQRFYSCKIEKVNLIHTDFGLINLFWWLFLNFHLPILGCICRKEVVAITLDAMMMTTFFLKKRVIYSLLFFSTTHIIYEMNF